MAIQLRRGDYSKFDPTKLLPGEYAIVLSGDPNTADGKAVYMCFAAGDVKRLVTPGDMTDFIANKVDDAKEKLEETVEAAIADQVGDVITNSQTAIAEANGAAQAAGEAASAAIGAASQAMGALSSLQEWELSVGQLQEQLQEAVSNAEAAADRANAAADGTLGIETVDDQTAIDAIESIIAEITEEE